MVFTSALAIAHAPNKCTNNARRGMPFLFRGINEGAHVRPLDSPEGGIGTEMEGRSWQLVLARVDGTGVDGPHSSSISEMLEP